MSHITILGTAGTRFVMITQRRHTGGLWFHTDAGAFIIDPGPGALVRAIDAGLKFSDVRGVLVTHRHLDHVNDLAVILEAITGGGDNVQNNMPILLPPEEDEPLIPSFMRSRFSNIHHLPDELNLDDGKISTFPLDHGVPTWALRFDGFGATSWGLLGDSRYIEGVGKFFAGCELLVANVTLINYRHPIMHLGSDQLTPIIQDSGVKRLIMTHMGNWLLDYPAEKRADELTTPSCKVIAATDGLVVDVTPN